MARKLGWLCTFFSVCFFSANVVLALPDSLVNERLSIHGQTTVVTQYKPSFSAKYTGANSLLTTEETRTSLTSTLYGALRLWNGATLVSDVEISGGAGLSSVFGVADATNGETFRVGSAEPKVYLARAYFRQVFSLPGEFTYAESIPNQTAGKFPGRYFALTLGKVSIADYFDNNVYSHDPRSQFLCWGLMSNGAWDYPANTRGYTPSFIVEYVGKQAELRGAISLMPQQANGNEMDWNIGKSSSSTIEYTRHFKHKALPGSFRLLAFFTTTKMGDYDRAVSLAPLAPDIVGTREYGNTKYGVGLNLEQQLNSFCGLFVRASYNDGKHETWAFTEIDRSVSGGLSFNGAKWHRQNDCIGLGIVASGLSSQHRNYLAAGGKGFMLGDGKLNYGAEEVGEFYYSARISKGEMYLSGAVQFIEHPGYNIDRGPVSVFSVRFHSSI